MKKEIKKIIHKPVLLNEAIDGLAIKPDGIYIDCTFGRGGHSRRILEKLSSKGRLFAIDKDLDAFEFAKNEFKDDTRFRFWHGSFTEIFELAKHYDICGKVNGILLDLGVSSPQLEDKERGFSFLHDGPLDMRMDVSHGIDAKTWINKVSEKELADVLRNYGEERYARRIARSIVRERNRKTIDTTKELAHVISGAVPHFEKNKHAATRSFQAIRIFINDELKELKICLEKSLDVLDFKGRLTVISFHSLEDRIVKNFFKYNEKGINFFPNLPIRETEFQQKLRQIGKPIKPSISELKDNLRSRSAVLRITEKIL